MTIGFLTSGEPNAPARERDPNTVNGFSPGSTFPYFTQVGKMMEGAPQPMESYKRHFQLSNSPGGRVPIRAVFT